MKRVKKIKILFICSAISVVFILSFYFYKHYIRPQIMVNSVLSSERYINKQNNLKNIKIGKRSLLIFGDSILEYLKFKRHGVCNFSIGGETISTLTSRLKDYNIPDSIDILCMIGINDLLFNKSLNNIYDDYRKLFKVLNNYKVKVYLLELLPISTKGFFFDKDDINFKVIQINEFINENSFNNYSVISTYKYFCNYKSELIQDFTYDGIHLNEKGKEKLILLLDK